MLVKYVFALTDNCTSFLPAFLACLFHRKSQAFVITRLSMSSALCKNFNVAHYSKHFKGINTKLG